MLPVDVRLLHQDGVKLALADDFKERILEKGGLLTFALKGKKS